MDFLDTLDGKPAIEVALAFSGLWRAVLAASDCGAGCAVVAVTVAADSPNLLQGAAGVFRAWRERLSDLLAKGGVPTSRAPAIAAFMISASEGAIALSRAERSFEPFDFVAAELRQVVETAVAQ